MNRPPADENGRNFFHAIAAVGQVKLATQNLASVPRKTVLGGLTAKDKRGRTPLHLAAYAGHIRVLRAFADAAPEAMLIRDQDGNTVKEALRRPDAATVGDPADMRYFQRLVTIDKLGYTFNEFPFGPADVWDVAVSNTSTAVIVRPTWSSSDRMLYVSAKNSMTPVHLGAGNVPRFVANSNVHTLVLTEDKCFAWGKNVNGTLGIENDGKTVHEPEPLNEKFVEYTRSFEQNTFSALGGTTKTEIKDPLIGVTCCDFHSACCSTTKVWAWGANRGQMMNKVFRNAVVETPMLVFESSVRIRDISCTDNALVVLLSNGHVMLLHNDRITRLVLSKGKAAGEAIVARGNYVAVQTDQGRLFRVSITNPENRSTIWATRRPKDAILSFDMSENGSAIVATKAGVYKIEEGRDVSEIKELKGMELTGVKTDWQFRVFVGVQRIAAALAYGRGASPIRDRHDEVTPQVLWDYDSTADPTAASDADMSISVDDASFPVHEAVLYARCPAIRPLIDGTCDIVAVPGGSAIFRKGDSKLIVSHAFGTSVATFVESLYIPFLVLEGLDLARRLESGPERHEFLALERLITKDLGEGLWDARLAKIGCDVEIGINELAHSKVLKSASPVLEAHLSRWEADSILPDTSSAVLAQVLRFAYTADTDISAVNDGAITKEERLQRLFELWQVADELLMSRLSGCCEQHIFEMLDFDIVVPLLQVVTGSQGTPLTRLRSSLLDVVVRYMGYFYHQLGDLDVGTLDVIESIMKVLEGSDEADKALAESYNDLKVLSQASQSNSSKKKKSTPAKQASTETSQPSKSEQHSAANIVTPKVVSPAAPSVAQATAVPRDDEGWIQQTRRKSRTGSQANQDKSGSVRHMIVPAAPRSSTGGSPALPVLGSAPFASPPSPAVSSASSSLKGTGVSPRPNVARTPPAHAHVPVPPASAPPRAAALPQLGRSSPSTDTSKIRNLPELPALGSQLAPRSGSAGRASRPKFSQKDRKKLQQFEDPFALVQQFENRSSSSSTSQTPWKQVTVASSQSVLERLERIHQINNKRASKGSVWGV